MGQSLGPGHTTDSVDADDGVIDNSGLNGHSYVAYPDNGKVSISFIFQGDASGKLPTQAGLVWTDGYATFQFEAFDAGGASLGVISANLGVAGDWTGATDEDRFFGVMNASGISRITISTTQDTGLEVDHLQYGFQYDLVAVGLAWNDTTGGVDARYRVDDGALPTATTAKLFWANGTAIANILSPAPITSPESIAEGTGGPGSSGVITFNVPASALANPEPGSTHILLVLDYEPPSPNGLVAESNENNNSVALPLLDLVAVSLDWNASGGLDAGYRVDNGPLPTATTASLFWASGTSPDTILSDTPIVPPEEIPEGTGAPGEGNVITSTVPAAALGTPAEGATHVLLVLDYEDLIDEYLGNNVSSIEIPSIELVDAVTFQQEGILPSDPNQYFSGGETRVGAVADGASRLVLRANLGAIDPNDPGWNLNFRVQGGADHGLLRPLNTASWSSDVPAALATQSESSKAVCIYESPVDFPAESPTVSVQLVNGASVMASKEIQIKRPPVVLVHGIWSNPNEAWGKTGAAAFIESQVGQTQDGFSITLANYGNTSSMPFDRNVPLVFGAIQEAISKPRSQGFACSQVDVVAHSMGGLLTRLMAQEYGNQSDNYLEGNVHKLITVGTPHRGSFVADELMSLQFLNPLKIAALEVILATQQKYIFPGSAVFQLSSLRLYSAIPTIDQVPVPSHAIVCTATSLQPESDLWKLYYLLYVLMPPTGLNPRFGMSDAMVLSESQRGGLTTAVTSLSGSIPHTSETGSAEFNLKAVELLRTSVTSTSDFDAAGFQHFDGVPLIGEQIAQKSFGMEDTNIDWLEILGVTNGQPVRAGDAITINLRTKDDRALSAVAIYGLTDGILITNAPFQALITVPQDSLGTFSFGALASDTDNQIAYSIVTVQISTTSTLQSIIINPATATLKFAEDFSLQVLGVFSDGISRNIASASAGTTYDSSDASRVSVDTNGVLRPIQNTTTPVTIFVTNGFVWTNVEVTVDLVNLPPRAILMTSATNTIFRAPVTTEFNGSQSADPESSPLVYNWDFGDGTTSTQPVPPPHLFSKAGQYVVRLVVTDSEGLNGTDELALNVIPAVSLQIDNTNAQLRVTLFGEDGIPHVLEGSSNLLDWIPIITNTPAGGSFDLLETNFMVSPQRFYRGAKP